MGLTYVSTFGLIMACCALDTQQDLLAVEIARFHNSVVTDKSGVRVSGVKSALECLVYCSGNKVCQSAFFTETTGCCQANPVMYSDDADWIESQGTAYYEMTSPACPSWLGYRFSRVSRLCYKFHVDIKLSKPEFQTVCRSEGGALAVLDTDEKFDHIADTVRRSPRLSSILDDSGFLLGIVLHKLDASLVHGEKTLTIENLDCIWSSGTNVSAPVSFPREVFLFAPRIEDVLRQIGFVMSSLSPAMFNWTARQSHALCQIATPDE